MIQEQSPGLFKLTPHFLEPNNQFVCASTSQQIVLNHSSSRKAAQASTRGQDDRTTHAFRRQTSKRQTRQKIFISSRKPVFQCSGSIVRSNFITGPSIAASRRSKMGDSRGPGSKSRPEHQDSILTASSLDMQPMKLAHRLCGQNITVCARASFVLYRA
jgi:hypothetical protein